MGGSEKAQLNTQNVQSRQNIATQNNQTRTSIANTREANVNSRFQQRQANAPQKRQFKGYVSMDQIRKYMADKGVSQSQAITDAANDGFVLKRR
jgi:hypothetical protein